MNPAPGSFPRTSEAAPHLSISHLTSDIRHRGPRHRRSRGSALLMVLWIGVLGGMLLVTVRQTASVDLSMGNAQLQAVRARWAARAGLAQAMATLAEDATVDDSIFDDWYDNPDLFDNVALDTGSYSVLAPRFAELQRPDPRAGVIALNARLNANRVGAGALSRLIADRPEIDPTVPAALLDFRDANANTRDGGAEGGYYTGLAPPYQIRDAPFQTLDELRLVKGMDDEAFLGEDRNRNGLLDPNEDDGIASFPDDDADGELDPGLSHLLSLYTYEPSVSLAGNARININTAGAQELTDGLSFSSALARAVVQQRNKDKFDDAFGLLKVRVQNSRGGNNRGGRNARGGGRGNAGGSSEDAEDQVQAVSLDWLADHLDQITTDNGDRQPARLNINLASRDVLMSFNGMTQTIAESIINYRTSNSGPLLSVGALRDVPDVSDQLFQRVAAGLTVRSNVFEVHAVGRGGSADHPVTRRLTAVVDRGTTPMRVLYWYED